MNRKRRKLKYIRQKNQLRKGAELVEVFKCVKPNSDELLYGICDKSLYKQCRKWKLNLKINTIEEGMMNDDFVNDLITVKIRMKI